MIILGCCVDFCLGWVGVCCSSFWVVTLLMLIVVPFGFGFIRGDVIRVFDLG